MQYGTIPDEQLLGAHVARRDEAAFAELVRRHVNLVFGTAFRVLGDASAAEEVAQNVFVRPPPSGPGADSPDGSTGPPSSRPGFAGERTCGVETARMWHPDLEPP